ncbi:MAG: SDR family NAD(P)-dependent oxidoreductase [Nocardioidaceae bacterium]|nr:SDR family NAD(P)-dependent oxidoreductase [Nocardioidaceae bacterium]NUS49483.1 SDR family NAD(P)-dependent oxidoreductase [Nocardioidaceae bacterium]
MRPLEEQTVLVTGATGGLGRALVRRLAAHGAQVVAHGRDPKRLEELALDVERDTGTSIDTVQADLADLREVGRLADAVLEEYDALHVLVNNAGVGFGSPGAAREVSANGIELRFAVNHLASYLLALRLGDLLRASAPARVVQVASAGQLALDPEDPLTEEGYDGVTAYRRAKLAQVMATYDLAADLVGSDVTVNALHPATFMDTTMVREAGQQPVSTVEEGLDATWRLVADPALDGVSGRYFDGVHEAQPDPQADDPGARAWVRALSDRLVADALV